MRNVLVIYHREDNDGACSAGIIDAMLKKHAADTVMKVKHLGVNYADLTRYWKEFEAANSDPSVFAKPRMLKWKEDFDTVFMVDISFNEPAAMSFLYEAFGEHFIWCDHHKPIIELSREWNFGNAPGIRRTDKSALMNTWYFMNSLFEIKDAAASDEMVKLSDWDCWAWSRMDIYKDENARENLFNLNVGITQQSNLNVRWFSDWVMDWLLAGCRYGNASSEKHFQAAWEAQAVGKQVRELDNKRIGRAVRSNGDTSWKLRNGDRVCVLFTTEKMNSQQFSALEDKTVRHGAVIKYDAPNGKWTASLYNFDDNDEFDCGKYLHEWYNGGGHKGAAGCTLTDAHVSGMIMSKQV